MRRRGRGVAAGAALCVSLTFLSMAVPPAAAALALPTGFQNELLLSGLAVPRDLDFLPSGDVLVIENEGVVKVVEGSTARVLLDVQAQVKVSGEQGFLGLAIDPDFPSRPFIYFHYSAEETPGHTRLSRFTFLNASGPGPIGIDAASEVVFIGDIPDNAFNHNGGTVRFGPDKRLYMSIGEDADPCGAQDIAVLKGKILRVNVNASANPANRSTLVPPDNPFVANPSVNAQLVYAYGLRNPFRFDIDMRTGFLYIGDVGQNSWEEVDEARGGENFGWPYYEGLHAARNRTTNPCANDAGQALTPPIREYGRTGSAAIILSTVYHGVDYPNDSSFPPVFEGALINHDFYSGELRALRYNQTNGSWGHIPGATAAEFGTGFVGVPATRVGPDGALYFVDTYQGQLRRIIHTPSPKVTSAASLPPGTVGTPYSFQLVAEGGLMPYTWTIASGTPPPGILLNATGSSMEGTPTVAGIYLFQLRVTDSRGANSTADLSVDIRNPVVVGAVSIPPAYENELFQVTLTASGGRPPYMWASFIGIVPGIGLQATTGLLAGIPTAPGTYDYPVRVYDADGRNASANFTIVVTPALRIPTISLPDAELFVGYSHTLNATGGVLPYTWALVGGSLPPGLGMVGARIEGTPVEAGVFQITLRVVDTRGSNASQMMDLVVQPAAGAPPFISVTFAPSTTLGQTFAWTIGAVGGYPPFVFSLITGQLPPGLSLAPDGAVAGVSTQAGSYSFTVQVADAWNQTNISAFTIEVIEPAHWIELLPVGEVFALAGVAVTPVQIYWGGENVSTPLVWTAQGLPAGLSIGPDGNITGVPLAVGNFTVVASATEGSGTPDPVSSNVTFALHIPKVDVEPRTLPTLEEGTAASEVLMLPDAFYPLNYSVVAGALPPGMEIDEQGRLAGVPTQPGNYTFTVRAQGPGTPDNHEDLEFSVLVNAAPPAPDGGGGDPYRVGGMVWIVLLAVGATSVVAFLLSRRAIRRQGP